MANYQQSWDGDPASGMRASDADRERTLDVLKAAYSEGRLTPAEHEQRMGQAHQARTYGELRRLVADLPQGPAPMPPPPLTAGHRPAMPQTFLPVPPPRTNALATASLVCGLAGLVFAVPSVPAIILGHKARAEIRSQGGSGDGLAAAGLVLGWLVAAFWGLILVVGGIASS